MPVLAFFFSVDDIGRFSLFQLVSSLSVLLFSMGLDQSYVREFHEKTDQGLLLYTCLMPALVFFLLFFPVVFYFSTEIEGWLFETHYRGELIMVLYFWVVIMLITRFLQLNLRMHQRSILYSINQPLTKMVLLVGLLCFGAFDVLFDFLFLSNLYLASSLIALFVLMFVVRGYVDSFNGVDVGLLRSMLRYSIPLACSGIAYWGVGSLDRFFIKEYSTLTDLGVYSMAISFAGVGILIQQVFTTIWHPSIFERVSKQQNAATRDVSVLQEDLFLFVHKIQGAVLTVVLLLPAVLGTCSWVLLYVLPVGYGDVVFLVVPCTTFPLLLILSEVTGVGIAVKRKSKYTVYASVSALLMNGALNMVLVPLYGGKGAAIATLFSYFVYFCVRTEASILIWKPLRRVPLYGPLVFLVFLSTAFLFFGAEYHREFIIIWLAYMVFVLAFYRKSIYMVLNLYRN
ncbi:hypothetical protein A9Q99_03555 [Gammaproteobacteria bacterium 45_16_T64]|nr:hypothetical protein A9Q99_03555 [Gammaproteobacteria bacterium 45_16_T64]